MLYISMAGREEACIGKGASTLQEKDSGRFLSLVLADLLAQVLGFREETRQSRELRC